MPVRYASRDPPAPAPRGFEESEEDEEDADVIYEWVPHAAPTVGAGGPPPGLPPSRSHAAMFVALALVAVGYLLTSWTLLVPALLAFALFSTGLTFLSARLNPLSIGFYLTTKPSWSAIGVVFLSGLALLYLAYEGWRHGWGPILPRSLMPRL
jgi:hypothetical protein